MIRPKFARFNAAAHFVEGLETWATANGVEVYPLVIPGGAERYPFVSVVTDQVRNNTETKDGGTDYMSVDVTVTVAVKEKQSKSGQEYAAELADAIVETMDGTAGEHDGYIVSRCDWQSGAPGYDADRACYIVDMVFALEVMPPDAVEEETEETAEGTADEE